MPGKSTTREEKTKAKAKILRASGCRSFGPPIDSPRVGPIALPDVMFGSDQDGEITGWLTNRRGD
jgi:hypothetical protein